MNSQHNGSKATATLLFSNLGPNGKHIQRNDKNRKRGIRDVAAGSMTERGSMILGETGNEPIEKPESDLGENHPKPWHRSRSETSPRKRLKGENNESDEGVSTASSSNSSSEINPERSSSGYEGSKSCSNGGSSDSVSASGQGNSGSGSGSGSDDGYCKSVTFSKILTEKNGSMMEEVECGSPTSSSGCSSTDDAPGDAALTRFLASSKKHSFEMIKCENPSAASLAATTSETVSESVSEKAPSLNEDLPIVPNAGASAGNVLLTAVKSLRPGRKGRNFFTAPYLYYTDHSRDLDNDPASPLVRSLCVPNFVAKMHAILIREELSDIIRWMPHGRSWKIVNPKEFELRILPTYFNHTKISSFYCQAKEWGFRRIQNGPDKGSFYNEYFLRGLPHLCKKMNQRVESVQFDIVDVCYDPLLLRISNEHPVPECLDKDDLNYAVLKTITQCVLDAGPNARLPVMERQSNLQLKRPVSAPFAPVVKVREGSKPPQPGSEESQIQVGVPTTNHSPPISASSELSLDVITTQRSRSTIHSSSSASSSFSSTSADNTSTRNALEQGSQAKNNNPISATEGTAAILSPHGQEQGLTSMNPQHLHNQQVRDQTQPTLNHGAQNSTILSFISSRPPQNFNSNQQIFKQSSTNFGATEVFTSILLRHQNTPASTNSSTTSGVAQSSGSSINSTTNQTTQQRQQRISDTFVSFERNEFEDIISGLMASNFDQANAPSSTTQQRVQQSQMSAVSALDPVQQQEQQGENSNGVIPNMSTHALRGLVAEAILLGARFGAESVLNQQNSSSSDSNGNHDDSSNTT